MARPRARVSPWLLVATAACTAESAPASTSSAPSSPSSPEPEKPAKAPPTPAKPVVDATPVGTSPSTLHMVARRYGPLRLQRLALDQLAVRGDLALAFMGADGHLHRTEHDLDNIDLATAAKIGAIRQFAGRFPDRSFLVGSQTTAPRTEPAPSVWRRVHNARWEQVLNNTFDGATPLLWSHDLAAAWPGGETVAVRVLRTLAEPAPAEPDPKAPPPRPAEVVRAYVELVALARAPVAPAPGVPTTPIARHTDAPDAVPGPDDAPVLADSSPASGPDADGMLPTAAADPPPPGPSAPAADPAPVPSDSPAPAPAARPAPSAAATLVFPRLPRGLIPRDLAAGAGVVYVMAEDGGIHAAAPRPRQPGRWRVLPESGVPLVGPRDFARLHAADSGQLYVLACVAEAPHLERWDGTAWHAEAVPSPVACPTSLAEVPGGTLWLATAPVGGHTLWQRLPDAGWTAVDLPRLPWTELAWDRWFAYTPQDIGHLVWERDRARNTTVLPELRASDVVAHGGAVWVVASAQVGRDQIPHIVLSTRQPPSAFEFPAVGEEGLEAEDTGDHPFDAACTTPFLYLRDLTPEEHGADLLPVLRDALTDRAEFVDTVLVEVVRRDGRRQLGAIWTNADALDEGFGPLGELGERLDKARPDVAPVMLCLLPRVRYGLEVRPTEPAPPAKHVAKDMPKKPAPR